MSFSLRRNTTRFLLGMCRHFRKYGWIWLLVILSVEVATHHWRLYWNRTISLPQSLFLVHLGDKDVKIGDYVSFYPPKAVTGGLEMPFMKRVACLPGEKVKVFNGDEVFCGNRKVAIAKAKSLKGDPLVPIPDLTLGADEYFLVGSHKDSFDSRYQIFGPINACRFIGKAYPLL